MPGQGAPFSFGSALSLLVLVIGFFLLLGSALGVGQR